MLFSGATALWRPTLTRILMPIWMFRQYLGGMWSSQWSLSHLQFICSEVALLTPHNAGWVPIQYTGSVLFPHPVGIRVKSIYRCMELERIAKTIRIGSYTGFTRSYLGYFHEALIVLFHRCRGNGEIRSGRIRSEDLVVRVHGARLRVGCELFQCQCEWKLSLTSVLRLVSCMHLSSLGPYAEEDLTDVFPLSMSWDRNGEVLGWCDQFRCFAISTRFGD